MCVRRFCVFVRADAVSSMLLFCNVVGTLGSVCLPPFRLGSLCSCFFCVYSDSNWCSLRPRFFSFLTKKKSCGSSSLAVLGLLLIDGSLSRNFSESKSVLLYAVPCWRVFNISSSFACSKVGDRKKNVYERGLGAVCVCCVRKDCGGVGACAVTVG